MGKLCVDSVMSSDYAMTQALVMVVVMVFVFTNFLVDIMYAWLDPRIRYA
ncbi:MAG: ABC transporter permease subunit [SAR324 cluster bacterium]|nr:ABC transporter permease subunit [SAR324 cluster bacterium]